MGRRSQHGGTASYGARVRALRGAVCYQGCVNRGYDVAAARWAFGDMVVEPRGAEQGDEADEVLPERAMFWNVLKGALGHRAPAAPWPSQLIAGVRRTSRVCGED